jgi:hypothetical protein
MIAGYLNSPSVSPRSADLAARNIPSVPSETLQNVRTRRAEMCYYFAAFAVKFLWKFTEMKTQKHEYTSQG